MSVLLALLCCPVVKCVGVAWEAQQISARAVVCGVNSALVRRWVRRATPVLLRQSDAPVISLPSEPPPLFELVAVLRRYERGTACWFFGM